MLRESSALLLQLSDQILTQLQKRLKNMFFQTELQTVCGHCTWQQLKIDGYGTQTRGEGETCPTSGPMLFRQEVEDQVT